jgi:hypothetical protein
MGFVTKCVVFRSDEASLMVENNIKMEIQLKNVYSFITSFHCTAYRTNLAVLEATRILLYKEISIDVDVL